MIIQFFGRLKDYIECSRYCSTSISTDKTLAILVMKNQFSRRQNSAERLVWSSYITSSSQRSWELRVQRALLSMSVRNLSCPWSSKIVINNFNSYDLTTIWRCPQRFDHRISVSHQTRSNLWRYFEVSWISWSDRLFCIGKIRYQSPFVLKGAEKLLKGSLRTHNFSQDIKIHWFFNFLFNSNVSKSRYSNIFDLIKFMHHNMDKFSLIDIFYVSHEVSFFIHRIL